jgi:H+/Cl- antiporter ClcA
MEVKESNDSGHTDSKTTSLKKYDAVFKYLLRWLLLGVPMAVVIGSVVAFFLWLLNAAVHFRFAHYWLLYLLPLAGLLIHLIYQTVGKSSKEGINLVMEQINQPTTGVPKLMAPVILFSTVITHLFGGSTGRTGTDIQIAGSIAWTFGSWYKLKGADVQMILTTGVAAGFGAILGTPLTAAIFAIEFQTIGHIRYAAFLPAFVAALVGSLTVAGWHVKYIQYHIDQYVQSPGLLSGGLHPDVILFAKVIVASVIFGLASFLFTAILNRIKVLGEKLFKHQWMVPVSGGLLIIALTFLLSKPDYLSLGIDAEYQGAVTIPSAFHVHGADTWSWFWKTIYSTLTLGTGFKGGEITPLFYVGATLGNTLSGLMHTPVGLFAALGFIAVFSGANNTPLAGTLMGIELFGAAHTLLFAVACFTAYFFSGHSGIFSPRKIAAPKNINAYKLRGYFYRKLYKYW